MLVVVIVVIGWLAVHTIYGTASTKTATRTATVQMGTVQSTVNATGNVSPVAALSVNFQSAGTVTEIDVKVGDQVKAGQTLAKIDDTQLRAALVSAQASLTSAQDNLASAQQPVTPTIAAQNAASLQTAQQQVATAQASLVAAQQTAAVNANGYQNTVNQAQNQLVRDTNTYSTDQANCATGTTTGSGTGSGQGGAASCTTLLNNDQATLNKDRDSVTNASQQQTSGLLKDQQSIQNAQNSLNSAQNNLATTVAGNNAKAAPTPASVDSAQAQVDSAQANLATAQKNEANAVLTAPRDGTITAVNGLVGQTVSAGSTTSASTGTSASGASGNSSSSSSSAFLTLDDTSSLQVVAGFAEVDASKVQVGQPATITLNALPNQSIPGQVTKVDVNSTVVSNVVTYNVTTTLTNAPTGVKPGMTASVSVVVGQQSNVLELPTADISTRGGQSTVTLLRAGKQITQVVTTGLVGDQTTEITSGVNQGDVVVAPSVSISSTGTGTGTGTNRGGIGGGGGGVFFGGGGGGLGGGGGGG
jgi:multidrug efflux pump subunit AcrA (membrane-fusion protein)